MGDEEKKEEVVDERAAELDALAQTVDRGADGSDDIEETDDVSDDIVEGDDVEDVEIEDDTESDEDSEEEESDEDTEPEQEEKYVLVDGKRVAVDDLVNAYKTRSSGQEKEVRKEPEGPSELELANEKLVDARKAYAKAQTGVDEDEIERALAEWEGAQREVWKLENQGPDIDEIEREIEQRISFKAIHEKFEVPPEEGGISDVVQDPRAKLLATAEVDRLVREEGADPHKWSTYEKAADNTREFLGWNRDDDDFEEKKKKKEKIIDIKTAQKKSRSTVKDEKPKTRDQILQDGVKELAKARGQEL